MLRPLSSPYPKRQENRALSQTFSLLLWNIHKENQEKRFVETLESLLQRYPCDLLLFQEFKHPKKNAIVLPEYSYTLASNIETADYHYGVMSAAKSHFKTLKMALSTQQELFIATHKSFLITQHRLPDDQQLYLVNLHAINFVTLKSFRVELQKIQEALSEYKGAMIVGGDFNSWSKGRFEALQRFQEALGLKKAEISASQHVKAIFFKPIDHLYYRDITLISAEAINTKKVSDHNPIYARFKIDN